LREQEWQAEIDRYDLIIARGQAIVKRMRQEELEDNNIISAQSDSKLSEPTSSLFNGIEGIQSGNVGMGESGDAEMGRADGVNAQDRVINSKVVGSGMGSGIGTEASPRRTRSGKVVQYCK
jgi:hypothetical protein